jgi:dTDP-glucose pyrophosphorylase
MKNKDLRWRETLLRSTKSIKEAINQLNDNGLQIVLVISENNQLLGTVTDGDIRRGILTGIDIDQNVTQILNPNFQFASPEMSQFEAKNRMSVLQIHHLPVLNSNGEVIGIHFLNDLNSNKFHENRVVVMAGGKGTRLHPYTENCPKPMLLIGNRPILHHILERAKAEGFYNFVFSIHYLGNMIEQYFGDGKKFGVNINYIREDVPLGTAGSLDLLDRESTLPIIVINGDLLTEIPYSDMLSFHSENGAQATMAVRTYEWKHPYGVVKTNGTEIVGYEEKPVSRTQINAGVYILENSALTHLPPKTNIDMPNFLESLRTQGFKVSAFAVHEQWLDVGRPIDFKLAEDLFRNQNSSPHGNPEKLE